MKLAAIQKYLATHTIANLETLFVELGWDRPQAQQVTIPEGVESLLPIAQKRGYMVFVAQCATMPDKSRRNTIEQAIYKQRPNKLIIFVAGTQRIWQFSTRDAQRKRALREFAEPGDTTLLAGFLARMEFGLDQEEALTLVDVLQLLNPLAEVEKVTKKFYEEFKRQHDVFMNFIAGIPDEQMQRWYASVMLNRLMFIYFLQKKQFVAGDVDYLKKNLDKYPQNYYQEFLCPLFFDGFAKKPAERSLEAKAKLGNVPYLNGGIFNQHQIEQLHGQKITIADEAFQKIFTFFDGWTWHLDDRPLKANSNEINPDVLGYIFEKYINQRQMGAYYTKEDITEYICRSTIVPFLLDIVVTDADWQLLADDPERYIFAAVRHGLELPLPAHIAAGITDVSKRSSWNTQADEAYKLPTEIWRETVARRQRAEQLIARMKAGEVRTSNQLITDNLDVRQFLQDVIARATAAQVMTLWHRLQTLSVLDPTVGSGAFLFAALNILYPIYDACLNRMAVLRADDQLATYAGAVDAVLRDINTHKSQTYTVLKRIMINNLYGVDIMEEAVEICKLRLFLKLTAQSTDLQHLEPLPDIDFNIRAGNTLVGYARLKDAGQTKEGRTKAMDLFETEEPLKKQLTLVKAQAATYRTNQANQGASYADKQALAAQMTVTAEVLNLRLADAYKVDVRDDSAYKSWKTSHRPFHWCSEFYEIVEERGGFDVIVGNPPYVEYAKVRNDYTIIGYETESCGNLYANTFERSQQISNGKTIGVIVPMSGHSTERMDTLIGLYKSSRQKWLFNISADANPSVLFPGVKFRLAIVLTRDKENSPMLTASTGYTKFFADERNLLFDTKIVFCEHQNHLWNIIPKYADAMHFRILEKIRSRKGSLYSVDGQHEVLYHNTPVSWIRSHRRVPYFRSERDGERISTQLKVLKYQSNAQASLAHCVIASSLFFMWYVTQSDCYHLNKTEIVDFPVDFRNIQECDQFVELSTVYETDQIHKSMRRVYVYQTSGRVEYDEFYPKRSKEIIDKIDDMLGNYYGLTDEETDYVKNFAIKYRMGLVDGGGDGDEGEE